MEEVITTYLFEGRGDPETIPIHYRYLTDPSDIFIMAMRHHDFGLANHFYPRLPPHLVKIILDLSLSDSIQRKDPIYETDIREKMRSFNGPLSQKREKLSLVKT